MSLLGAYVKMGVLLYTETFIDTEVIFNNTSGASIEVVLRRYDDLQSVKNWVKHVLTDQRARPPNTWSFTRR